MSSMRNAKRLAVESEIAFSKTGLRGSQPDAMEVRLSLPYEDFEYGVLEGYPTSPRIGEFVIGVAYWSEHAGPGSFMIAHIDNVPEPTFLILYRKDRNLRNNREARWLPCIDPETKRTKYFTAQEAYDFLRGMFPITSISHPHRPDMAIFANEIIFRTPHKDPNVILKNDGF